MNYKQMMDEAIMKTIQSTQKAHKLREWNPDHPPAPDELTFSSVLFRELCKEKQISFYKLAKKVKMSGDYINNLAGGHTKPEERNKKKLMLALGVPVDYCDVLVDYE